MNRNGIIYTVIFSFLTAFFFVFFLALADGATREQVELNKIVSVQKSVLKVLNRLPSDEEEISETYNSIFTSVPQPGETLNTTLDGNKIVIRYFSGSGLWGTITGVIGMTEALDRITGLDIISHNETPGLGGRIDEDWFKEQFRGEKIGSDGIIVAKGSGNVDMDKENSIVDGITGASLTSSSMAKIVNGEIEYFRSARPVGLNGMGTGTPGESR